MGSKRNHSALPVIKRVRNADKTEEAKPASANASAYFQSIRPRTESAVLGIRKLFGTRHDRDERHLRGCGSRLAVLRAAMGNVWVRSDGATFITHPHVRIALGKGGTGNLCGLLGNLLDETSPVRCWASLPTAAFLARVRQRYLPIAVLPRLLRARPVAEATG